MPRSTVSAVKRQPAPIAAACNRRLTIRHGSDVNTQVIAADEQLSAFQKVRVHDLSQGGVALILPHAPRVGTTIFLQMCNTHLDFTYDLAAEVRHTTPHQRSSWLVGLEFERALSADELAGLV